MGKIISKKKVEMTLNGHYWLEAFSQIFAEAMIGSEDFKDGKDFRVKIEPDRVCAKVFRDLSNENPSELHSAIERELNKLTKAKYQLLPLLILNDNYSEVYAYAEVIKEV